MRNGRPAELVMGSVQLGLSYGATNRAGKPSRDTALRLVRRAANAGVAAFDTARAAGASYFSRVQEIVAPRVLKLGVKFDF